jgi:hypothetical protein
MTSKYLAQGQKFGNLTVVRMNDRAGRSVLCFCTCQRTITVSSEALRNGVITSCGCRPLPAATQKSIHAERVQGQRRQEIRWRPAKTE